MRHFSLGLHGYCVFSLLDARGEPLVPPATQNWSRIHGRVQEFLRQGSLRLFQPEAVGMAERPAFQAQVFLEQYSEPAADVKAAANAAHDRLAARAAEVLHAPSTRSELRREDFDGE
jgi:hypothetical protein